MLQLITVRVIISRKHGSYGNESPEFVLSAVFAPRDLIAALAQPIPIVIFYAKQAVPLTAQLKGLVLPIPVRQTYWIGQAVRNTHEVPAHFLLQAEYSAVVKVIKMLPLLQPGC